MRSPEALALSVVLIGFAGAMRAVTGTWLQPAAFFPLFWCFAGIIPLLLAPQEPVGANAMIWLIAASLAVATGAVIGNGGLRTRRIAKPPPATDREITVLSLILLISVPLGLGSSIGFLAGSAVPLSDLFDLEKLVVVSNQAYFARYAEGGVPSPPFMSRALLPFVYLAPAIGGLVFELRRERAWKLLALSSYIPAIAVTVIQTTKAAMLFAIVLWLSGYFAARLRLGKLAVFTRGHLLLAAVFGGVLMAFFFAVQLARLASTDTSLLSIVMTKLVTAAFGHMTVFSQWLSEYWHQPFNPTLGTYTFAGPLEMLGLGTRIPGIFDSLIELVAGDTSNVFTAFRPLIEDFTMPGALAVLALLGFVGGVGFRMVSAGRWSAVPLLMIAYTTTFWTPVTWIWLYNSLTATIVAVGLIVFFIRLLRGSRPANTTGERIAATT